MTDRAPAPMHVMAGALLDARGRVLLAQRPPGKHLAGCWEFPGGKLEPGEAPLDALARELHEELGIEADPADAMPLIRVPWAYGARGLLLDAWRIDRWRGTPAPLDGQALRWCAPMQVDPAELAPADRAILQALRLPSRYLITPAEAEPADAGACFERLRRAIKGGERLLQLRLPNWPVDDVRALAARLLPLARAYDAQLLLNADVEGARALGANVGVHLKATQFAALAERPLPWRQPVGASCHDAAQLAQATRVGVDFATLSPLAATASHPGATPLGWDRFGALAAQSALPVYALGGVGPADAAAVRRAGGQGVAGIRAFW
ncbi:Nudix family hydrolase [Fulvimonas sp. R45]|uniref:Nudix family hydrolase n=1 Tax=Fulvimonas sp. R45 TaxID=3045937 RepID=UPI00265EDB48|nr:Nudix family hydrolase [Fulvimonas sp. R45]MDO1530227.1 Nudix family hydrolase [Fulvimonas sp. R45]